MKPSTSDSQLIHHILAKILTAVERIERRFVGIRDGDDFLATDEGLDRLDGSIASESLSSQLILCF
jgi:hypothetical protein